MNLRKNILFNFSYQILALVLPFITAPYLSRTIGAEGVGIYSFSQSIALYFTYIALLGLSNYGNRAIAEVQDDENKRSRIFFEIYSMQLCSFLISFILYLIYVLLFSVDRIAALIMIGWVVSAAFDINWFFFGMEQFKLTVIRNTIIKVISVACIFLFIHTPNDQYLYILIMVVSTLLSQICLWPYLKRYIHFVKPSWKDICSHVKPNLKLFIPVIAASLYNMMDKVMLGYLTDMEDVGFYENADKIVKMVQSLIVAIGTVMLPRMTSLFAKNEKLQEKKYLDLSFHIVVIYVSAAIFGILSVSNEFCTIYFGTGFEKTSYLLNILVFTVLFFGAGNVLRTQMLIPQKKDGIYIKSAIFGAALNLVVNLILIPKYGSFGAAIATVLAEIVVCVYQFMSVRNEIDIFKYIFETIISLCCGGLMFVFLNKHFGAQFGIVGLTLKIIAGAFVYLVLTALTLGIEKLVCSADLCKGDK